MNRFKCPACGGNQYTSADTAEGCIYCGHKELKKMDLLLYGTVSTPSTAIAGRLIPGYGLWHLKKSARRMLNKTAIKGSLTLL